MAVPGSDQKGGVNRIANEHHQSITDQEPKNTTDASSQEWRPTMATKKNTANADQPQVSKPREKVNMCTDRFASIFNIGDAEEMFVIARARKRIAELRLYKHIMGKLFDEYEAGTIPTDEEKTNNVKMAFWALVESISTAEDVIMKDCFWDLVVDRDREEKW
jgi:hypothetical protein